jgi:hypothetical protein
MFFHGAMRSPRDSRDHLLMASTVIAPLDRNSVPGAWWRTKRMQTRIGSKLSGGRSTCGSTCEWPGEEATAKKTGVPMPTTAASTQTTAFFT